jgi:hypothetical protein
VVFSKKAAPFQNVQLYEQMNKTTNEHHAQSNFTLQTHKELSGMQRTSKMEATNKWGSGPPTQAITRGNTQSPPIEESSSKLHALKVMSSAQQQTFLK